MEKHLEPVRIGTRHKKIWISDAARERIQAWADENATSFSAAIETLALIGIGERPDTAMLRTLVTLVRRAVHSQMDRYGKLAAIAAIQSGLAEKAARSTLRLAVQEQARRAPEAFRERLFTAAADDPAEDAYQQLCRNARQVVARQLRTPISALLNVPALPAEDQADADAAGQEAGPE